MDTLRRHNRRSVSAMCAELITEAIKLPKYRQQIEEALIQVPAKEDPRQIIPQRQRRDYSEEAVIGKGMPMPSGLTANELDALVTAKREGKLTEEQNAAAVDQFKSKPTTKEEIEEKQRQKKELLVSVLKELMED